MLSEMIRYNHSYESAQLRVRGCFFTVRMAELADGFQISIRPAECMRGPQRSQSGPGRHDGMQAWVWEQERARLQLVA
ncbi:hypothetical protein MHYP_G00124530 [Metynnis hypsauchen]